MQLTATAVFSDGTMRIVTAEATWQSNKFGGCDCVASRIGGGASGRSAGISLTYQTPNWHPDG